MRFVVLVVLTAGLFFTANNTSAEIYKWIDKDGSVHFTDSAPPAGEKAELVNPEPNQIEGYGKVPAHKSATRPAPGSMKETAAQEDLPIVELFVTSWCGYCKKAEAYFTKRNIPYVKYDVEKDRGAARRKSSLTQSRGVPFVLIGDIGIPGYSEAAFERALRQYQ
jgi:glutaredoxin